MVQWRLWCLSVCLSGVFLSPLTLSGVSLVSLWCLSGVSPSPLQACRVCGGTGLSTGHADPRSEPQAGGHVADQSQLSLSRSSSSPRSGVTAIPRLSLLHFSVSFYLIIPTTQAFFIPSRIGMQISYETSVLFMFILFRFHVEMTLTLVTIICAGSRHS